MCMSYKKLKTTLEKQSFTSDNGNFSLYRKREGKCYRDLGRFKELWFVLCGAWFVSKAIGEAKRPGGYCRSVSENGRWPGHKWLR